MNYWLSQFFFFPPDKAMKRRAQENQPQSQEHRQLRMQHTNLNRSARGRRHKSENSRAAPAKGKKMEVRLGCDHQRG